MNLPGLLSCRSNLQPVTARTYRWGDMAGKEVLDSNAVKMGVVRDLILDEDGDVSLVLEMEKGDEKVIPFARVERIGDVILLSEPAEQPEEEEEPPKVPPKPPAETTQICQSCGHENEPGDKFCIKCGTKLSE
ncbi:MAG: zinc-ribbon domain-containing protein [Candidatus Geothermarchaeales archaeon]